MKKILLLLFVNILLFLMLPFLVSQGWTAPLAQYLPSRTDDITDPARDIYVPVLVDDAVEELPLTQYLCGVVAAEMPASYESEALKAQAVAACSYMVYRSINEPDAPEHKGAWVCNDPSHCKGYLTPIQMKQTWGEDNYPKYYAKIAAAVGSVAGQIMTFDGKPVNAVFHAISSGKTETAADVWGQYLSSVDYSKQELYRLLSILAPRIDEELVIGEITRSNSGGVRTVEIGGIGFTGAQLRSALSLRSTNFEIAQKDDIFTFTVKGYGHCVGMSQHGAGQLAAGGMSYSDILKTYYTGISIESYSFP